jgi:hypothetical protein
VISRVDDGILFCHKWHVQQIFPLFEYFVWFEFKNKPKTTPNARHLGQTWDSGPGGKIPADATPSGGKPLDL